MQDIWEEREYQEVLEFVERRLWLFVQESASLHRPKQVICNFAQLSFAELRVLQSIYYLLSSEVRNFIGEDMPYLLRHLPQSAAHVTSEMRGIARGNIDWSRTLKLRWRNGNSDPTLFVSHLAVKTSNLPEIQAMKYALVKIRQLANEVLGSYEPQSEQSNLASPVKWRDCIRSILFHVNAYLQHVSLRDVETPNQLNNRSMQRVRCARNTRFVNLFKSLDLYSKLFVLENRDALRDCIAEGVLKPLQRDILYEIYILFATYASLERIGLTRTGIRLIGYGKGAAAQYQYGDRSLIVYYQSLPPVLAANSLYTDVLSNYNLGVSLRRPDMLLEFEAYKPRFNLIEVKRTRNKTYIADSFYKVLGYLKDFGQSFEDSPEPQGLLVVWEFNGNQEPPNDIIVLLSHQNYQQYLEQFVRSVFIAE